MANGLAAIAIAIGVKWKFKNHIKPVIHRVTFTQMKNKSQFRGYKYFSIEFSSPAKNVQLQNNNRIIERIIIIL